MVEWILSTDSNCFFRVLNSPFCKRMRSEWSTPAPIVYSHRDALEHYLVHQLFRLQLFRSTLLAIRSGRFFCSTPDICNWLQLFCQVFEQWGLIQSLDYLQSFESPSRALRRPHFVINFLHNSSFVIERYSNEIEQRRKWKHSIILTVFSEETTRKVFSWTYLSFDSSAENAEFRSPSN